MSKSTPKSKASAASGGVALSTAAAASVGIARGGAWDYNDAINMNESRKVFYLYRGVLIVLVVALPDCTEFLGFTLDYLLRLNGGDITKDQFDKAVWLICNAMNYLDRGIATSAALRAAYDTDYGSGRYFIENFTDEMAKRGLHTVIAKSISRIVIRFLFAFSLNLRGLNAANVAAHVVVPGAGDGAGVGAGAGDEARITRAITEATGILTSIQQQLPGILTALLASYDAFDEDQKQSFIQKQFEPIITDLRSLGHEFQARVDDIVLDINNLTKPLVPVTPQEAARLRDQVIRISPRTFRTKVLTLEGFINKELTDHIRDLTHELEKMQQDRETRSALDELLQSAGNTFKGLHPISGIVVNSDRTQIQNGIFVQSLLEKALVMQANISKLLLTPVTIAYKPSIQEFLSRIGLLDSNTAAAITGDDQDDGADGADDDDSAAHPLAKRLRRILEPVGAQSQCEQTIGKLGTNPSIRCYICGGGQTGVTMECEHIFCIGLAIEYFGLLRCSGLSNEEKNFLSILYAWAHRCCNRLKSNISFMKVNPNYKIPQPPAAAVSGRNNFFMFHQENASKLLGEIYNNDRQHDCRRIIDKQSITKAQFVSAKVPVVSANVLPLVDVANTVFGTVFAASTVLFTAMSCFKNIASLLVIQAATRGGGGGNALTLNTGNMIDGFNSILPGVFISDAPGRGGSRMKKNNYVGGMQPASNERPPPPPPQSPPVDVRNFLTNILGKLTLKSLELEEPIQEELKFYHDRRTHIEEPPIICEDENPESVPLQSGDSIIPVVQKYSFLFKLTSITHNLNPMCLYSQLLLENEDYGTQNSNIVVFGTICDNYIQNNRRGEGIYTLNDLSVILLCQIAVYGLGNFNNVTGFNVVAYISRRAAIEAAASAAGAAGAAVPSDNFSSFSTSIETIFSLTSRGNFPGGPIRHHTGTQVDNTIRLRETFTKLCLLRLNRYKECFETASYLMSKHNEYGARTTVNNFIRDDLYLLYCPFAQESKIETETTKLNLYKQQQFQTYLTSHDSNYLEFFEYMIDYTRWNDEFSRTVARGYIPPDNSDSQPPASPPSASQPPKRTISAPASLQSNKLNKLNREIYSTGNDSYGDITWSLGGRSLKKNKHNNTKKNKHRLRKPANSRRNKSNYKYKIKYTIKHHKSRRNNRSRRK